MSGRGESEAAASALLEAERGRQAIATRAVLVAPGQWRIEQGEAPRPRPGEIRVRLEGCGVCASGLPAWEGREWFQYPMAPGALGHEGWGVVEAAGGPSDAGKFRVGDRVAFLADGSYSSHLCLPESRALALPEALDSKPFPAEPVGCAVNVFERSRIQPGTTALIIGMGFLGCLLLQLTRLAGARAICISARPFSREIAARLGAAATLPLEEPWRTRERMRELGCESVPVVIEAAGAQQALDVASEMVGERGRLVVAGYHQDGLRQVNMQQWNWKGIDVINAHERAPERYTSGMRKGIELAASGKLDLEPLLTRRYPLRSIGEAYRDLAERPAGFVKGWIDLSEEGL